MCLAFAQGHMAFDNIAHANVTFKNITPIHNIKNPIEKEGMSRIEAAKTGNNNSPSPFVNVRYIVVEVLKPKCFILLIVDMLSKIICFLYHHCLR